MSIFGPEMYGKDEDVKRTEITEVISIDQCMSSYIWFCYCLFCPFAITRKSINWR